MEQQKFEVILFQPFLRKFVLNFGKHLKRFTFCNIANPPMIGGSYHKLPNFEKEVLRTKTNWKSRFRRIFGIPNVRPYLRKRGDILFTYGCLVLTNKPYCTYIETGIALYNYDLKIAKNPIARCIVTILATRSNCKKLIFVSEASRKSFFSSVNYGKKTQDILMNKSVVVYPLPLENPKNISPKTFNGTLKLLFPGTFYMKGGMEVVKAYEKLKQSHPNITLTIITALHMLREKDLQHIQSIEGIVLQDARLNENQMTEMYSTHDILLLPTYREGFGLVLVEALSYGMPLIVTDQYATGEMAIEEFNGFLYPNPLKDYDSKTYQMFGQYHNPTDFYKKLFTLQESGNLAVIENFIIVSIEKILCNPELLSRYSQNSLDLYNKKFHPDVVSEKIEAIFLESLQTKG